MKRITYFFLIVCCPKLFCQTNGDSLISQLMEIEKYDSILIVKSNYIEKKLSARSLYYIGLSYSYAQKDYLKSAEYINKAIQKGPATNRMYYNQALNYQILGQDSIALNLAIKALAIKKEPFIHNLAGWLYSQMNDEVNSFAEYLNGVQLDSTNYEGIQSLIQKYVAQKKIVDADEYYNRLKRAYLRKELPEEMAYYFVYDIFHWKDKILLTKMAFPDAGDPETEGSFSKIVLFVYDLKYQEECCFEAVMIHQMKPSDSKYVLNKRIYIDGRLSNSQSFWSYTFPIKIDFIDFRNAAISILEGKGTPEAESYFK